MTSSAFQSIQAIDYTVIFVRDMAAMRRFYEDVLGFPLARELSSGWIEYRIGANTLALATPSRTAADTPTPTGSAALQLAFKVSPPEVDRCADELTQKGVALVSPPPIRHSGTARFSSATRMATCWKSSPTSRWLAPAGAPRARRSARPPAGRPGNRGGSSAKRGR